MTTNVNSNELFHT